MRALERDAMKDFEQDVNEAFMRIGGDLIDSVIGGLERLCEYGQVGEVFRLASADYPRGFGSEAVLEIDEALEDLA